MYYTLVYLLNVALVNVLYITLNVINKQHTRNINSDIIYFHNNHLDM
jgi:hypothetical protein